MSNFMISIALSGDAFVGKTCFFKRFSSGEFNPNTQSSVGSDVVCKKLMLDGKQYNVQLWDTAGQEIFRSTTATYIRNRHCILFMYDITNRESFEHIEEWMKIFYDIQNEEKKTLLLLIGCKCDMITDRKVSTEEGRDFAKAHDMTFFECSAKDNINTDTTIEFVVKELRARKMLVNAVDKMVVKEEEPIVLQKTATQEEDTEDVGVCC
ncbi:Rab family GTPase [Entamoeba marina]